MIDLRHELSIKEWLIDALPHEVIWASEDGKIVYANAKFCIRLGYKKSELMKLSIFDINTTVTKESWIEHWEEIKREKVLNFKAVHKNKSGKFYDVEVFAQFFSNNGKEMICSIISDITTSSFNENLLRNTEAIAHVGGWKLNLQDGSIIVTEEALRIFETQDRENFTPGKAIKFFANEKKAKNLFRNVLRGSQEFDEILETKSEPKKFIRAIAKPIFKGKKVINITGIYQDVTEQYQKASTLKFFKEIIDNAQDLVYVYNRKGTLLHYSDSVSKQLGFSRKELDNFSIFNLDSNITQEWWYSHFDELKEKRSMHMEWLVTRKDGTKFPAEIVANHLVYEGQDINCAVVRDVTERKMRDLKLFEALEEIKSLKELLENENEYLQEEISSKINYDNIICKSAAYEKVLEQVNQVAPTDTTVLITGESGTGKELLARALHNNSLRQNRALIKINCATLPKELIESELFGHKKGAFTGAVADKVGKFALADNGTIFLDEIGEMPIDLQPKLLRVLQEGEFDELGGSKTIKVNVRVIAATNRHLEKMIKEGAFREDLYYRLNVFPIHNIPLRAHKEDIPLLAQYFLKKYSSKAGKAFKRLSKKTIDVLMAYNFPGNIRELENLIERAVIVERGTTLNPGSWMPKMNGNINFDDFKSFETMQRDYIIKVLNYTNWRVSGKKGAATILNMKDKTLFAKMKRLGIEKKIVLKN
ncbi:sigma 54-interacting transcriptional regulator [Flavivirga abyssicola]|uniref:sigma 54-interacting transcriptional regulator n=1 Tax=Flavivirga abyssicola TaxID=3063533 RepID=UPI0026E0BC3B|nr:sigma 54-interacting transcriptional regulator [Flavivirga sp. MEBiC07777]WVK13849.1 sigma 54-interacting transcriptional regulator [Flavivirga sp. MEBiC07777]